MSNAYANLIKGTVFTCTNTKNAVVSSAGDNALRGLVACGQLTNAANSIFETIGKYDNLIGQGTREAQIALKAAKEGSSLFNVVGKVSNFAANNVNPILCVASGIRVINAEDKKSTIIEEAGAMGSMFTAEFFAKKFLGLMKDRKTGKILEAGYKNIGCLADLGSKFSTFCNSTKLFGKISLAPVPGIVKGILFCAVSLLAFKYGKKLAKSIADKTTRKEFLAEKSKEENGAVKQSDETAQNVSQPLETCNS